ncbi:MAG: hypothetical protein LBT40_09180 [Deltaproteobacteria bacterium]|jgi:hypothetical protein|nr:hypothetical protein [Deltaproteobacteria bacterium]
MQDTAPAYAQTAARPLPPAVLTGAPDYFTPLDASPPYPGHVTAAPFWENLPDFIPVEIGQSAKRQGPMSLLKQPLSDEERARGASGIERSLLARPEETPAT